jgi:hypothetical protein
MQQEGDKSSLIKVNSMEEMPFHDNIFCFTNKQLALTDPSVFA